MTIPTPDPRLTRDHLEQVFAKMAARRVVVVGDAMLDIYLAGDAERISPEAPVPVVTVHTRRAALGGAANVAANVAAIGAECRLVAVIGDDARGDSLRAELHGPACSGKFGAHFDRFVLAQQAKLHGLLRPVCLHPLAKGFHRLDRMRAVADIVIRTQDRVKL